MHLLFLNNVVHRLRWAEMGEWLAVDCCPSCNFLVSSTLVELTAAVRRQLVINWLGEVGFLTLETQMNRVQEACTFCF